MNANELAEDLEGAKLVILRLNEMLRQQQAEMGELEKENTDLRYLIATKLEQQDGISLNSMAHPITNTPEPSYEIDPDKLETIEIDLPSPEPVAWIANDADLPLKQDGSYWLYPKNPSEDNLYIPLYTQEYINRLQAEIEALKEQLYKAIDAEKDRRFE